MVRLASLFAIIPAAFALSNLSIPSSTASGTEATITWKSGPNDRETITLFLMDNKGPFNLHGILAENIKTSLNKITITLPEVAARNDYLVKAVIPDNVDFVLASSPIFAMTA
jgi:hypothetical protein